MPSSPARAERLAALRAEVRALESAGAGEARLCLPFGVESLDSRLAGGGLPVASLNEAAGTRPGPADEAAAILFLASVAARRPGIVLWALRRRDLFAPGLAGAGLPPDRLLYAECDRDEDVLAVMEEGLRHGGLAAVVGEVGRAAMPATRRLQLAAEEGGTLALMLRRWRGNGEDPLGPPSAAVTRWRLACAPSSPPSLSAPVPGIGRPRWRLSLARQRGGAPFDLIMESPDAEGRLALPSELEHRPGEDGRERRAA
ncbi:MAG TPA: protein ImuA [Allosphingosinicella sp.]|nr:protein ImuA [Allosphingosinicella sp.]